ncbi:hypothetical protein HKX48_005829 [Thoreauomyces humboldtii]|nr:hypothetical protein HKX48_005829 [Thoreauomyces humboldtii]
MYPNRMPSDLIVSRSEMNVFMHALLFGMLLIGLVLGPLLERISAARNDKDQTRYMALSMLFYGATASIVVLAIAPWTALCIGANPFGWIWNFVLEPGVRRLAIVAFWVFIIASGVTVAWKKFPTVATDSTALNFKRKYFHVLATMMFIPGYVCDADFMHLAFSVAFSALILLEYVRHFRVWPVGGHIQDFLHQFLNQRDCGPVIVSHLYLLVGCALPVWLNRISQRLFFGGLSGMLTLGIGDTMASICGKRFGRTRWPGTVKTVEGTFAFNIAVMSVCLLLNITGGLLEAVSDQNDNLIIPLYTFAITHLTLA